MVPRDPDRGFDPVQASVAPADLTPCHDPTSRGDKLTESWLRKLFNTSRAQVSLGEIPSVRFLITKKPL
jgi:hypothetical protein